MLTWVTMFSCSSMLSVGTLPLHSNHTEQLGESSIIIVELSSMHVMVLAGLVASVSHPSMTQEGSYCTRTMWWLVTSSAGRTLPEQSGMV